MEKEQFAITTQDPEIRKIAEEFRATFPTTTLGERLINESKTTANKFEMLTEIANKYKEIENEKWVKISEKGGFGAYWKESDSGPISIKSVGEFVNYTPIEVAAILINIDIKKKYDKQFKDTQLIEETANQIKVVHLMFNGKFPVKQRDFVVASAWDYIKQEKVMLMVIASIIDSRAPENKDYVRGKIHQAFYIIRENGKGGSIVTYIANMDPSGSIPGFIKKWAAKKQSKLLSQINKVVCQKKKK